MIKKYKGRLIPHVFEDSKLRILNIVGARPNFMKIAPLMAEYKKYPQVESILVHTGQHCDEKMSQLFFEQLNIPQPDINLEVGSASHAVQTAKIMERFEPLVHEYKPDLIVVVGDVNSTIACALVAVKLGVKVAHVEAGLRSFDRTMPEEINRLLTDAISDYLFVSEPSGLRNLKQEGISGDKVFFVGNVMIDTLKHNLLKADNSPILNQFGLKEKNYVVLTLHRPANVDDIAVLERLLNGLRIIAQKFPIIFPVHPRTKQSLHKCQADFGIRELDYPTKNQLESGIWITEPLSYLHFLKLIAFAKVVLTDSGGIQEETTILKIPCLTLRKNTERPITVEIGTNILVGNDPENIPDIFQQVISATESLHAKTPELWDGHAAERIVKILVNSHKGKTSQG